MVIVSTFHTVHAKRTAKNFTQKKALIIGNYKYRDRSYHLRTPKQDVRELKRTLKKAGFTVQVKENLSAYEMEKALFRFGKTLDKNTLAYVHYAGHGIELDGDSLLLGVDFYADTKSMARKQGYPVNAFMEVVTKAGLGVISVDACRNNPFITRSFRSYRSRGMPVGQNVDDPITDDKQGVILIYSTAKGQKASDGKRTSPFIASFQQSFKKDKQELIFTFFANSVQNNLYKATEGEQKIEVRTFGYIPKVTLSARHSLDDEEEMWKLVKQSDDPEELQLFMESYPKGRFLAHAKLQLKRLQKKNKPAHVKETHTQSYTQNTSRNFHNSNIIFQDDFIDNKNNWAIEDRSNRKLSIQNQSYVFEHKKTKGGYITYRTVTLPANEDFLIETHIRKVSGTENHGYGLLWGSQTSQSGFRFYISSNGYYKYSKYVKGESTSVVGWKKSAVINQGKSSNSLAVKRIKKRLYLIINGHIVEDVAFEKLTGSHLGFVVDNKQKVQINHLKVTRLNAAYPYQSSRQILFEDYFMDKKGNWIEADDKNKRLKITGGYYFFKHKRKTSNWTSYKHNMLNPQEDVRIEMGVTHVSGVDNYGYGIYISNKDLSKSLKFLISANQYYLYSKYKNKKSKNLVEWTKDKIINKKGYINHIKFEKHNGRVRLFINDKKVKDLRLDSDGILGKNLGFYVARKQEVKIDYMRVTRLK